MKNKLLFITICLITILCLTGCEKKQEKPSSNTKTETQEQQPIEDNIIIVFIKRDATEEEITELKNQVLSMESISSIDYKTKEDIKNETMSKTEPSSSLYAIMSSWDEETNPLEPEFIITIKDSTKIEIIADQIKKSTIVSKVVW